MVVFIPKVGGRVVILPKSFGQISLTSFLLKTMEKAVDNHLITRDWSSKPKTICVQGGQIYRDCPSWVDGDITEIFRWEREMQCEPSLIFK